MAFTSFFMGTVAFTSFSLKCILMTTSLWEDMKTNSHNSVISPGTKMNTRRFEYIEEDPNCREQILISGSLPYKVDVISPVSLIRKMRLRG